MGHTFLNTSRNPPLSGNPYGRCVICSLRGCRSVTTCSSKCSDGRALDLRLVSSYPTVSRLAIRSDMVAIVGGRKIKKCSPRGFSTKQKRGGLAFFQFKTKERRKRYSSPGTSFPSRLRSATVKGKRTQGRK